MEPSCRLSSAEIHPALLAILSASNRPTGASGYKKVVLAHRMQAEERNEQPEQPDKLIELRVNLFGAAPLDKSGCWKRGSLGWPD